jgi:hypothetical protein
MVNRIVLLMLLLLPATGWAEETTTTTAIMTTTTHTIRRAMISLPCGAVKPDGTCGGAGVLARPARDCVPPFVCRPSGNEGLCSCVVPR